MQGGDTDESLSLIHISLRLTPLQMEEIFLTLCSGSVHSHETEIAAGYVTLGCGCRAGLAGRFYCPPGQSAVLQELRSVNIRVARSREFPLPQKLRDKMCIRDRDGQSGIL